MGVSSPMALKAAFLYEVTIFQPTRPFVKWSSVEKRFASRKGCSDEVEAVMPKAKFLVTAAIAVMGFPRVSIASIARPRYTYDGRVRHRPLRCPSNTLIELTFVGIVSSRCVCQEQSIDVSTL